MRNLLLRGRRAASGSRWAVRPGDLLGRTDDRALPLVHEASSPALRARGGSARGLRRVAPASISSNSSRGAPNGAAVSVSPRSHSPIVRPVVAARSAGPGDADEGCVAARFSRARHDDLAAARIAGPRSTRGARRETIASRRPDGPGCAAHDRKIARFVRAVATAAIPRSNEREHGGHDDARDERCCGKGAVAHPSNLTGLNRQRAWPTVQSSGRRHV